MVASSSSSNVARMVASCWSRVASRTSSSAPNSFMSARAWMRTLSFTSLAFVGFVMSYLFTCPFRMLYRTWCDFSSLTTSLSTATSSFLRRSIFWRNPTSASARSLASCRSNTLPWSWEAREAWARAALRLLQLPLQRLHLLIRAVVVRNQLVKQPAGHRHVLFRHCRLVRSHGCRSRECGWRWGRGGGVDSVAPWALDSVLTSCKPTTCRRTKRPKSFIVNLLIGHTHTHTHIHTHAHTRARS